MKISSVSISLIVAFFAGVKLTGDMPTFGEMTRYQRVDFIMMIIIIVICVSYAIIRNWYKHRQV